MATVHLERGFLPVVQPRAASGEPLDGIRGFVHDKGIPVDVNGDAARAAEFPGIEPFVRPSPGDDVVAIAVELLNPVVVEICGVDPAHAVDGQAHGAVEFPVARPGAAPLQQVVPFAVEFLDAIVVEVRHVDVAVAVHDDIRRGVEFAIAAAGVVALADIGRGGGADLVACFAVAGQHVLAPRGDKIARAVEDGDAVVAHVGHVQIIRGVDGDARRAKELAFAVARTADRRQIVAVAVEFLDIVIEQVGHIDVARAVHGDVYRVGELTGTCPGDTAP